jgi:hypothetical protein
MEPNDWIREDCKQGEPREDNPYHKDAVSRDAWYSDAYNTGFEACKQGEPREDNPYHIDTVSRDAWYSGWDDAK